MKNNMPENDFFSIRSLIHPEMLMRLILARKVPENWFIYSIKTTQEDLASGL